MLRYAFLSAAIVAVPLAGTGCDLVQVDAKASEVCLTGVSVDLPGGAPDRVDASHVEREPAAALPADLDASAKLTGVAISAVDGIGDFGFLRRASIHLGADGLPEVNVLDLDGAAADALAGMDSVFVSADGDEDLIDYLLAPELTFDVAFAGEMPEGDWSVALDLCFSGSARL